MNVVRAHVSPTTLRASAPGVRPSAGVPWVWMAIVAGVAIAVYANSLGGALLYDDVNAITDNARVVDGDLYGIHDDALVVGRPAATVCGVRSPP